MSVNDGSFDLTRIKEIDKLINYPVANDELEVVVLEKLGLIDAYQVR